MHLVGHLGLGFEMIFKIPNGITIPSAAAYPDLITAMGYTGIQVRPTSSGTNIRWDVAETTYGFFDSTTRTLKLVFADVKDLDGNLIPFNTLRYGNAGDYLNLGANEWEVVLQGDNPNIPSCIRATDAESGSAIDPRPILKFYRQEVIDTLSDNSLDPEDYRLTEIDFNGPLEPNNDYLFNEGDVPTNTIYAIVNSDNYLYGTDDADQVLSLTAKDQNGNTISQSNNDLATYYYPDIRSLLDVKLTGGGSGFRTVALRWSNINTVGATKIFWDISIRVDSLEKIPGPSEVQFSFLEAPDGIFTPYSTVTQQQSQLQSLTISGLSGKPMPEPPQNSIFYGIPNDRSEVYGPGAWATSIEAPMTLGYWEGLGYDTTGIDATRLAQSVHYDVVFTGYVTNDGESFTSPDDDPYPNIGLGLDFDHNAKTITNIVNNIAFRSFAAQDGTNLGGGLSEINKCDNRSQSIQIYPGPIFWR